MPSASTDTGCSLHEPNGSIAAGQVSAGAEPWSMARYLRPVLVVLAIGVLVWLVLSSGVTDQVRDDERLRQTVNEAGVFGPVLFVALMVLLVPLNVPGVLFVVPSAALFGPVGGVLLSLLGGFGASAVGVAAARRLGRSAFESRMPPRIQRVEGRLRRPGSGASWLPAV
jgi:uncharacterized membrane protein YdjX (TVP38/TMEM64 family)